MGYVPIVCHICEGPLDFPGYELKQDANLQPPYCWTTEAVRKGRVHWLLEAVGVTENNSALDAVGGVVAHKVVRVLW